MVGNITSLTNNGLRDWLVQRVSAVVMTIYVFILFWFYVTNLEMDYVTWLDFFSQTWMVIASLIVLLNIILHAYIGLWTVSTDYIKPTMIRIPFQVLVVLVSLSLFIWGFDIFWSL